MRSTLAQSTAPVLYDRWFIFALLSIVILGLLMMTSSSIVISDNLLHQPFYFLFKQLVYMTLGIFIGAVLIQIDTKYLEKVGGYFLLFVMLMLALVLMPGIGHKVNGSARWIGIGPLGFQVSELAKFAVVIYMAGYLLRRNAEIKMQLSGFLKPMLILMTVAILLLREPDFGATVVV